MRKPRSRLTTSIQIIAAASIIIFTGLIGLGYLCKVSFEGIRQSVKNDLKHNYENFLKNTGKIETLAAQISSEYWILVNNKEILKNICSLILEDENTVYVVVEDDDQNVLASAYQSEEFKPSFGDNPAHQHAFKMRSLSSFSYLLSSGKKILEFSAPINGLEERQPEESLFLEEGTLETELHGSLLSQGKGERIGVVRVGLTHDMPQVTENENMLLKEFSDLEHSIYTLGLILLIFVAVTLYLQLGIHLSQVKEAQKDLVQTEKMASLGQLVAGVAHEINTPIGIGVTAASHFDEMTKKIKKSFDLGTMKKSDLVKYLTNSTKTSEIILKNLFRTGDLIRSFKMISSDQASLEKRSFFLKPYLEDIILSLKPQWRKMPHQIEVYCPSELEVKSYPGAVAQVITNLVLNSLLHAFEKNQAGTITISVSKQEKEVIINHKDNGKGIPTENLSKIFDPFFTTKRGKGGTGLGLNICYNVVKQTLKGDIRCESEEGEGTQFIVRFPKQT